MKLCQAIVLSSLAIFVRIRSVDGTPVLLQPNSTSASASTSANANTAFPGPAAAQETPGFVNNGTVGTYPCALPAELAVSFASGGGGGVDPSSTYASTATAVRPLATVNHNNTATRRGQEQVVYSVDTGFSAAGAGGGKKDCSAAMAPVYPYNPIRLRAPDDSIRATFLPYAATLSELWVKDRWGQWRDVVLGFDNKTNYGTDSIHPDFAPVVGRYANRIKNGTFELDGTTYNTTLNENGVNTLHGGNPGYDRSSFSVSDWNASSVTFKLHDPDGNQGFPSAVDSEVSYTLSDGALWTIRMNASASGRTLIMLSSHVYWQLEAYNETEGATILDHVFHLPRADKYIETDSILIPTGVISNVSGTGYDFRQARTFRSLFNRTQGFCGAGCQGWDTCFVMSEHERDEPVIELWSTKSGIKLSVRTDQDAFQVYTCDGISHPSSTGSLPRKIAHAGDGTLGQVYENHSCVVLEAQDYIDAVNHPEWGRDPIYSAERPYVWQAEYSFSTV